MSDFDRSGDPFKIGDEVYFFNGKSFEFATVEDYKGADTYILKTKGNRIFAAHIGPVFVDILSDVLKVLPSRKIGDDVR
jgi:hypothetical protein